MGLKNVAEAKIWGLYLKKQRFGANMHSPEGLEDSPFRHLSLDISHPFEFSIAHVITTVQAEIKNMLLMVVIALEIALS